MNNKKTGRKTGRRLLLNDEMIETICQHIESGMSNTDMCDYLGIVTETYYGWLRIAENQIKDGVKKSIFITLSDKVRTARQKFKQFHIQNINKASSTQWQASAWMLERRFNDEYGRADKRSVVEVEETEKAEQILVTIRKTINEEDSTIS